MYVYKRSEPGLYTVGHYDPAGKWHPESDHESKEAAGDRVAYLNGGDRSPGGRSPAEAALLAACDAALGSDPLRTGKAQVSIDHDAWKLMRAAVAKARE